MQRLSFTDFDRAFTSTSTTPFNARRLMRAQFVQSKNGHCAHSCVKICYQCEGEEVIISSSYHLFFKYNNKSSSIPSHSILIQTLYFPSLSLLRSLAKLIRASFFFA